MAIQQFEGRMASINAQLNILWDEALATNNELNMFLKKLEEDNTKRFLDVDITRYDAMVIVKNTFLIFCSLLYSIFYSLNIFYRLLLKKKILFLNIEMK